MTLLPSLFHLFMDLFYNLSIISWNIKGAFGRLKKWHVREVVRQHQPSLFFAYETHGPFARVDQFWSSLGFSLIFSQEARGHSGGIWILSSRDDLSFKLVDSNIQEITFSIKKGNASWICTATYASPTYSIRCNLWDHFITLRSRIHGPWVIIGDFNEILYSSKVSGGTFSPSWAHLVANMMNLCNLTDLHTIGGLYTWRKNFQNGGHVRKMLDRCMVDIDW